MQKEKIYLGDPRGDKKDDHEYWQKLLWNCWHTDQTLYYLLHGIRCGGAEVIPTKKSFCLMPGEWDEAEWNEIKRDKLSPFKDKLINIFKLTRVGRVLDEPLPDGIFKQRVRWESL
ncbi:MAG TPA: hypothetical protein VN456_12330 [Desulfosporosinus sp.]|nr:hypothetical protein [Desulfosporosinus sp.]